MPVTLQNWTDQSGRFLQPRSGDLVQIDRAVARYRQAPGYATLRDLAAAILAWRAAKGAWHTSIRAREMAELINLVKAEARVHFPQAGPRIFSWLYCEPRLSMLVEDTRNFLTRPDQVVVIHGHDSGPKTFRLEAEDDDGVFREHNLMSPLRAPRFCNYTLSVDNAGPGFLMESVAMHTETTPTSSREDVLRTFHPISRRLFTTGQLSGCTFLMRRNQGTLECAHIQPGESWANGYELQDYLEKLNLPGTTIYGRKQYRDARVGIIGCLKDGLWNVYAQRYHPPGKSYLGVDHILVNG